MATQDEIMRLYHLQRVELESWIAQRWVRPSTGPVGGWQFDEVDEARIALIRELRDEFEVSDEALGLVLSLLDQLYAARRMLRCVDDAMQQLPEPLRVELRARLRRPAE